MSQKSILRHYRKDWLEYGEESQEDHLKDFIVVVK